MIGALVRDLLVRGACSSLAYGRQRDAGFDDCRSGVVTIAGHCVLRWILKPTPASPADQCRLDRDKPAPVAIEAGTFGLPGSQSRTLRSYKKIHNRNPMPDTQPPDPPVSTAASCRPQSAHLVTFVATDKSHSLASAQRGAKQHLYLNSTTNEREPPAGSFRPADGRPRLFIQPSPTWPDCAAGRHRCRAARRRDRPAVEAEVPAEWVRRSSA